MSQTDVSGISLDSLTATLLEKRGIVDPTEVATFLSPDFDTHTHDPFLLPDMEKAVVRILKAIENDERITIWSDYDTDGIPGAVILHDLFKKLGYENFENYIPHRIREGFGLHIGGVEAVAERGSTLIITIDCGITDVAPVARANELGVDVIITDHHLPHGDLPGAVAIVNPKMPGSAYPYDMLCGAAVAWKLAVAILTRMRQSGGGDNETVAEGWEKWLLDMAGLATLSDMVPLRGENRVIARYGLVVLRKSRRPGVQKLCRKLRLRQSELSEDDVGFMISPRINAASRMGIPEDALRMLATSDEVEAGTLVDHLDKINNERKGHVAAMVKEVKAKLAAKGELAAVIVTGNPAWKPSLLGLVANSLATEYRRPVFLWGREDGEVIKGSCRSDGIQNLVELMSEIREVFIDAGGHAFSGGFSLSNENVFWLEEKLLEAYERIRAKPIEGASVLSPLADAELSVGEVNETTWRAIDRLAPFGEGNPKPVFLFRGVIAEAMRMFGKSREHLSITLRATEGKATAEAIAFFKTPDQFTREPAEGVAVDLIGSIERSFFGGRSSIRLRIVDIL